MRGIEIGRGPRTIVIGRRGIRPLLVFSQIDCLCRRGTPDSPVGGVNVSNVSSSVFSMLLVHVIPRVSEPRGPSLSHPGSLSMRLQLAHIRFGSAWCRK